MLVHGQSPDLVLLVSMLRFSTECALSVDTRHRVYMMQCDGAPTLMAWALGEARHDRDRFFDDRMRSV